MAGLTSTARAPGAAVLALLAVAVAAHAPAFVPLARSWLESPSAAHGVIIAALIPLLVWRRRELLVVDRASPWPAAAGLLLGSAVFAAALVAGADALAWLVAPFDVWCAVWLAFGWRSARALALPLGLFLVALPVWAQLAPFFQQVTVAVAGLALRALAVRAYIEDEFVTVGGGTFEIAEGCSGIGFVVVAVATALLLICLDRPPLRRALALLAASVAAAVLANCVRVVAIIVIGERSAMQSPLVHDHYWFGWWIFAATFLPFVWFARRHAPHPRAPAVAAAQARSPVLLVAGLVAVVAGPAWAWGASRLSVPPPPPFALPELAGWEGPQASGGDWRPRLSGATRELAASYEVDRRRVDAYLAYLPGGGIGRRLVGFGTGVDGAQWHALRAPESIAAPGGGAVRRIAQQELAGADGRRRVVWAWYEVNGVAYDDPTAVRLRLALGAFGRAPAAGLVALSTDCSPDCSSGILLLQRAYAAGLGTLSPRTAGR